MAAMNTVAEVLNKLLVVGITDTGILIIVNYLDFLTAGLNILLRQGICPLSRLQMTNL